jgi:peptide/nickel transport system permease protein
LIKRDISTLSNLQAYPWLLNPVWFLLGVTLAFSFIGDALRDFYDPYHTIFAKKKGIKDRNSNSDYNSRLSSDSPNNNPTPHSPLPTPQFLLEVTNLHVEFTVLRGHEHIAVQAVRGLSFSLQKGECLGIVGESGSGKSVSTLAIPGLLAKNAAASGSVLYNGKELLGLSTEELREYRGKKIGMIFQEPGRSFDPLQNMGSVFFETFRNSQPEISQEEAFEKAEVLLAETGLERGRERLGNFPHQFSGGQLQRIGIALALAQGCELLIADEPTTALDVTIQKQIVDLLKTLRRTRGISIIFISHDIELVAEISDRIMVMYGGMVMESVAAADISSGSAKHPYTKALLASSPRFGSHYSGGRLPAIPGRVSGAGENQTGCPFAPRCVQVKPECSAAIPPLVTSGVHELRCKGL